MAETVIAFHLELTDEDKAKLDEYLADFTALTLTELLALVTKATITKITTVNPKTIDVVIETQIYPPAETRG